MCRKSGKLKSPGYEVDHVIKNMNIFFSLNCNDWIRDKEAVLDQCWALLDEAGFLRNNALTGKFKTQNISMVLILRVG